MTALLERLDGAREGSRELDDLVLKATGHTYHMDFGPGFYDRPGHTYRIYGNGQSQVTTSIDAALALAERVLPGRGVGMTWLPKDQGAASSADVWLDSETDEVPRGSASTPALAICAALIRATAKEEAGG